VPNSDEPSETDDLSVPTKRRSRLRMIIIAAAVVVVVVVGGPFIYIHFIEGSAPSKLTLSAVTASDTSGPAVPLDGTWSVTTGSQVGYRVGEVLFGQNNTAVGRTTDVTGSIAIKGSTVSSGSFTVNMTSVHSDESQRDGQFRGRIMDTSKYPTATFTMSKSIDLGSLPASGVTKSVTADGNLTLHGTTRPVTIPLTVEHVGTTIEVLGDVNLVFANWNIPNPSFAGTVTTQDHGILEFLLHLTKGASTQVAAGAPTTAASTSAGGPSGPGSAANEAFQACLVAHGVTLPAGGGARGPAGGAAAGGGAAGATETPSSAAGAQTGAAGGPSGFPGGSALQSNPKYQAAFQACASLQPARGSFTQPTVSPTTVPSLQLGG
jgi:polyisoprenoid-binding protein YceI